MGVAETNSVSGPQAMPAFPYDARVELALDAMSSAMGLNLPRFQALLGAMVALRPEDLVRAGAARHRADALMFVRDPAKWMAKASHEQAGAVWGLMQDSLRQQPVRVLA